MSLVNTIEALEIQIAEKNERIAALTAAIGSQKKTIEMLLDTMQRHLNAMDKHVGGYLR